MKSNEYYSNWPKYQYLRLRRQIMRAMIGNLVRWGPLADPTEGYTVLIGCRADLLGVVRANLTMLRRQDRTHMQTVIMVFDQTPLAMVPGSLDALRKDFSDLPLQVICYSSKQVRVARRIGWAWVYSWMSWAIGIAATQTRYAILHDLDAMLIGPGVLRERYETIHQHAVEYLGDDYFTGNGFEREDELVRTYELMVDVPFVRRTFRPIDLFNNLVEAQPGKIVDYDTFLWAQHQGGRKDILPIDRQDMVHPSQMICQFTELVQRGRQPARKPNLPLIAYLFEVGGDGRLLIEQTEAMRRSRDGRIAFFGTTLDLSALSSEHAAWLGEQCSRMERVLHGGVRAEVVEYLGAMGELVKRRDSHTSPSRYAVAEAK